MKNKESEQDATIEYLIRWAVSQPNVRAMLLTSSRANLTAPVDVFSDYDVILAVRDIHPFYEDRTWLGAFGMVLALYRDPLERILSLFKGGYVVQFESGLKIDFTLWTVETLQRIAASPELPDELDAGYFVLLDKDHLTDDLNAPTNKAYIPKPPTETEYQEAIEVFFLDTTYVAKYLCRDDLVGAKYILDYCMKQEHLRPMLEWRMELDHNWSVKPGLYGRNFQKWLRPDLWAELEGTYTGADLEANWQAMYNTIALFRKVGIEVGDLLRLPYPLDLDRRVMAYLQNVKRLDRSKAPDTGGQFSPMYSP